MHRAQPGLPPAPEDGVGGIAIPRAADRPTGARDSEPTHPAPGGSAAARRGARSRSGSAQQIIAEVGAQAATFASQKHLSSWVGACPGDEESAGVSTSHRSPKGNRQMRRILNQCANAAVRTKGSIFEIVYRRLVPRLGHNQTIGAIAHRLCRLIWIILHRGVRYEERGQAVCERLKRIRTARMIRQLRSLGYRVEPLTIQLNPA
jgi:Transposase IS116/IS110/IS902 family